MLIVKYLNYPNLNIIQLHFIIQNHIFSLNFHNFQVKIQFHY